MSAKRIVLGVTGGVAAYKSADLVRRLREAGADVRVVMTRGGQAFVTPLTFQAVSGHPVHTTLLDDEAVCVLNSDCNVTISCATERPSPIPPRRRTMWSSTW